MNRPFVVVLLVLPLPACVVGDVAPDVDPYGHQVRISGGWFDAREDDQLPNEDDGGAFEVGGTFFSGPTSPLALDAQIAFATNRYDTIVPTPPFGTIDARTTITTSGFELGPRLVLGRHQDLRAFVRGGGGLYSSTMEVDATASGIEGEYDEDDFAPGAFAGFGFEGRFQRVWIGFEWRWTFVEGDFGAPFDVSNIDLGGGVAALTLGFAF
jgi:hypothetical protein